MFFQMLPVFLTVIAFVGIDGRTFGYLPMSKGGTLQAGAESSLLDVALDALAQDVRK